MRSLVKFWLAVMLLNLAALAQDARFNAITPVTQVFTSKPWVTANGTYIFTPLYAGGTIQVYLHNNSSFNKNYTIKLSGTANPGVTAFTGNASNWQLMATTGSGMTCDGTTSNNQTSSTTVSCFSVGAYVGQVAITIAAATAGGTTDTVDMFVAQGPFPAGTAFNSNISQVVGPTANNTIITTPGINGNPVLVGGLRVQNPVVAQSAWVDQSVGSWMIGTPTGGPGDSSTSGTISGPNAGTGATVTYLAVVPFMQVNDTATQLTYRMKGTFEGLMVQDPLHFAAGTNAVNSSEAKVAGFVQRDVVNPAAAADMLNITSTAMFHIAKITIDCTVACDVILNKVSSVGVTCTALTIQRVSSNLTGMSTSTASRDCVTAPTLDTQVFHYHLAANDNKVFDVSEFWEGATANRGFDLINGAAIAAGTISFTVEWFER